MEEITLRELKKRINKIPEEKLDKDLDELYINDKKCLEGLFEGSAHDIVPWWDFED